MKKSLSRVLSLALALVMLLGAMPFALATGSETPTVTVTASKTTANVGDEITFTANINPTPEEGTAISYSWDGFATATTDTLTYRVAETDAGRDLVVAVNVTVGGVTLTGACSPVTVFHKPTDVTISGDSTVEVGKTLQLTGAVVPSTADPTLTWKSSDETIATVDEKTGLVKGIKEGKVTITANSSVFPTVLKPYVVEVKPASSSAYAVEIKGAKDLYLNEKDLDTAELSAKLIKVDTKTEVKDATFEWFSNEYVNVDSNGKVTARKAGKASVFVIATYKAADGKETTVKSENVEFNVVENVIECKAGEVPYSTTASFKLEPKIEGVPTASFTYKIVSEYNYGSVSPQGLVTPDRTPGVARVEITASWTGHTVTKVVPVSFYEQVDVTATVKTGVSSFLFGDSDVFSAVAFENKSESKPSAFAMRDLYKSNYTNDWTYVTLKQADPSSTVASITYPGSSTAFNGFNPNSSNLYEAPTALRLKFTCLKKGTFKLDYSLTTTEGLLVRYGTITINTQEGAANIKYKTSYTNSVTINEKDFAQYWKDSKMTTELDYVKFGVSNVIPYYGELYTTNSATTRKEVTASMSFDYNATSKDTYDLDLVTFVPSASKKTSYTEEIPFTCYGSKSETLSGVMVIEVTGDLPFKDVKTTDWFYEDVAYVYNNDIMNGTAADKFEPNSTLTRAMVVTMLYRIEGEPSVSYSGAFKDVTKNQWYTEAVEWAAKNDIVNGFDANTFGPSRAITREQLAAILYRYANYKKLDTSHGSSLSKFYDSDKVSSYAKDALEWAVYEGIMNGEAGNLKPTGTATRAQAAAMFHRFLED